MSAVTRARAAQARRQLPVTLVLGLATSAVSLQQMLQAAAADCLQTRHFQLVQARARPCRIGQAWQSSARSGTIRV
jgi:hypothetical protein